MSTFWSIFVIVLIIINVGGCLWLIAWTFPHNLTTPPGIILWVLPDQTIQGGETSSLKSLPHVLIVNP